MNRKMNISVAMAAYNGEAYIATQIESILKQFGNNDELVVSVDPSTDSSVDIVKRFSDKDNRIILVYGNGKGLMSNFENAIRRCSNEIIFLSDQDDIWMSNKIDMVLSEFSNDKVQVVLHDATLVDENGNVTSNSFFEFHHSKQGFLSNVIKNSYMGCCMAFRKSLCDAILPFPSNIPMHDQWIGLLGELQGGVSFINEPLILYRRHNGNASSLKHENILQMILWRIQIIFNLLLRKMRMK